jgi:hypothetical protein
MIGACPTSLLSRRHTTVRPHIAAFGPAAKEFAGMTMSAFPSVYAFVENDGERVHPPRAVASPGNDPIFPLREEWQRAAAVTAEKTRLRDRLEREALRLRPAACEPDAAPRLLRKRDRILRRLFEARHEEAAALAIEDALIERILQTPPETIPGIVAKLQFLVRYGAPSPDSDEFPWPQMQALQKDLQRLTATEWVRFDS